LDGQASHIADFIGASSRERRLQGRTDFVTISFSAVLRQGAEPEYGNNNMGAGKMINFGIVGYGYWGPNVARNFHAAAGIKLTAVCDLSGKAPGDSPDPLSVHQGLAESPGCHPGQGRGCRGRGYSGLLALRAGQRGVARGQAHLRREPFTSNSAQAQELVDLAAQKGLRSWSTTPSSSPARSRRSSRSSTRASWGASFSTIRSGSTWALPARRQRHLGPGPPRPVRHGVPHQREAGGHHGPWVRPFRGPIRGHRLHQHRLRGRRIHRPFHVNWLSPVKVAGPSSAATRRCSSMTT